MMKSVTVILLLLFIIGCNDAADDNDPVVDNPSIAISPFPELILNKEAKVSLINITPAGGWQLRNAYSVIDKDTLLLHGESSFSKSSFSVVSDWCMIEKCSNDTLIQVDIKENTSGLSREIVLYLSYCGIRLFSYKIIQHP